MIYYIKLFIIKTHLLLLGGTPTPPNAPAQRTERHDVGTEVRPRRRAGQSNPQTWMRRRR